MNVRKMFVIPSEFYDSLVKKSKIVEDPILKAQIRTEDEKEKILKRKNTDKAAALLSDISHKQLVLEEQRKKKLTEPIPVTTVHVEPNASKKRGRPPKLSYFEFGQRGEGLLKNFYTFEPKGKNYKQIVFKVRK